MLLPQPHAVHVEALPPHPRRTGVFDPSVLAWLLMSTGIAVAFARIAMVTAGLAWELAEGFIAEDPKLLGRWGGGPRCAPREAPRPRRLGPSTRGPSGSRRPGRDSAGYCLSASGASGPGLPTRNSEGPVGHAREPHPFATPGAGRAPFSPPVT